MGVPRPLKRVRAIRRAPDGSAFETCDECGVAVAVALSDMHECETKREEIKRFKGVCAKQNVIDQSSSSEPRSAFRLFMESFVKMSGENEKLIDIDQLGFETWKNMSKEERKPYEYQAELLSSENSKALRSEENAYMMKVDQEADSADVGKYDQVFFTGSSSDEYF